MINFDDISPDEVIAKGQYSIVRAAHEDALKRLRLLLEEFTRFGPALLKQAQPEDPASRINVNDFQAAHDLLFRIETLTYDVEQLRIQREDARAKAWQKGGKWQIDQNS